MDINLTQIWIVLPSWPQSIWHIGITPQAKKKRNLQSIIQWREGIRGWDMFKFYKYYVQVLVSPYHTIEVSTLLVCSKDGNESLLVSSIQCLYLHAQFCTEYLLIKRVSSRILHYLLRKSMAALTHVFVATSSALTLISVSPKIILVWISLRRGKCSSYTSSDRSR